MGKPPNTAGVLDLGAKPRILVSRTDRIGDVVLSLPVVGALQAAYPEAGIDFLVRREIAAIVTGQPGIAGVIEDDPAADGRELVCWLGERRYDAVVCLYPRPALARAYVRAKIPVRIGTARRWYSFRFTHRVNISRRASRRHEKDLNLDLLQPLGILPDYSRVPKLVLPLQSRLAATSGVLPSLREAKWRPLIVLHPGDGGSAQNWPIERYAQLAGLLARDGANVLVTGIAAEKDRHLAAFSPVLKAEQILSGRTDLGQLMALLAGADLFVGGSTGPLHIAAAFGTPVVGLYGPIRTTTPDRWGPCGDGHQVLVPDVPVCRCKVGSCKLGNCMDRILVDAVLGACQKALRARTRPNKIDRISDLLPREA